jgi:hypothetical protein
MDLGISNQAYGSPYLQTRITGIFTLDVIMSVDHFAIVNAENPSGRQNRLATMLFHIH